MSSKTSLNLVAIMIFSAHSISMGCGSSADKKLEVIDNKLNESMEQLRID